jgi:PIN domain nuclease of toxin-antitoxin system
MTKILFDASALLAFIKQEKYEINLDDILSQVSMSLINVSEVTAVLMKAGFPIEKIKELIFRLVPNLLSFDNEIAFKTGELISQTKELGLSFGDRACIATAIKHKMVVYTADKAWIKLKIENLEIILIR